MKTIHRAIGIAFAALISALPLSAAGPALAAGSNTTSPAPTPTTPAPVQPSLISKNAPGQGGCVQQYSDAINAHLNQALIDEDIGLALNGAGAIAELVANGANVTHAIAQGVADAADATQHGIAGAAMVTVVGLPVAGAAVATIAATSTAKSVANGAQVVALIAEGIGLAATVGGWGAQVAAQVEETLAQNMDNYVTQLPNCDSEFAGTVTVSTGGLDVTGASIFNDDVGVDGSLNVADEVHASQVHATQGISAVGGGIWLGDPNGTTYSDGITLGGGALSGAGEGGAQAHTGHGDAIAIGNNARAERSGSIAFGLDASSTGSDAVAIGRNARAAADGAIALGGDSAANGTSAVAIGTSAQAAADGTVAIGLDSSAAGTDALAIGTNAQAAADGAIAIGSASTANGEEDLVVGAGNRTDVGGNNTVVGNAIDILGATSSDNTVLGVGHQVAGSGNFVGGDPNTVVGSLNVATGVDSSVTGDSNIAIGDTVTVNGDRAVAVGNGASANADDTTAIGTGAQANATGSAAFGQGAVASRERQQVFGTAENTYATPGITSDLSRARQSGALEVATTDAAGNLATDGGEVFETLSENQAGIAIAMAMATPTLTTDETFGVGLNWGVFEHSHALAFSAMGVVARDLMGAGERISLTGGFGVSVKEKSFRNNDTNTVFGGRAGVQLSW